MTATEVGFWASTGRPGPGRADEREWRPCAERGCCWRMPTTANRMLCKAHEEAGATAGLQDRMRQLGIEDRPDGVTR